MQELLNIHNSKTSVSKIRNIVPLKLVILCDLMILHCNIFVGICKKQNKYYNVKI